MVVEEIRVYKLPCCGFRFFVLLFVWIRLGGLIMLKNRRTPKRDHTTPAETCCSFFQYILLLLYIDIAFSVTTKSIRTAGRVKREK
jgi:hypothetical protein